MPGRLWRFFHSVPSLALSPVKEEAAIEIEIEWKRGSGVAEPESPTDDDGCTTEESERQATKELSACIHVE